MASVPFPKYIIPQSLKEGEYKVACCTNVTFVVENEHCALTFSAKKNNNKKSKKDLLPEFPKPKNPLIF
jgi:hypothetical protein